MRNYLVIDGQNIAFQYPDDRELAIGTELALEIASSRNVQQSISQTVKVEITEIIEKEEDKSIFYHCKKR